MSASIREQRPIDSDSDSDDFDPLNVNPEDEEGWDDVEPDVEEGLSFQSLFDATTFDSLASLVTYDTDKHAFDLRNVKKKHGTSSGTLFLV